MKKLTFKVSSRKDSSVISLVKEVNKISCRVFLDLENGFVVVENVDDSIIDSVIDLVDNYYTIMSVDIDNIFGETTEKTVMAESVKLVAEKQSTVLEPQSKDDLIIKKVEFENEYVEKRINSFLKTAYWALYNRRATEKEIGECILTCMSEITMRYSSKPVIRFSIGDIVDMNYGSHLPGEVAGGHVHAIVCNTISENMAYVVPVTKVRTGINSKSYLFMDVPHDVTYDNELYQGGTVLVDKGKYVRAERFHSVVGKITPTFFERLLYQLASTFDFTDCLAETVEEEGKLPLKIGESLSEADKTAGDESETNSKLEITAIDGVKPTITTQKVSGAESALVEVIGFALDKVDPSKKVEEQVETFLNDIGMTTTEKMVMQSFMIACDIKKINYENVIFELHKQFPKIKEELIKNTLKEAFKSWLYKYPTLAEKCPKISIMAVLKVFAKKFA